MMWLCFLYSFKWLLFNYVLVVISSQQLCNCSSLLPERRIHSSHCSGPVSDMFSNLCQCCFSGTANGFARKLGTYLDGFMILLFCLYNPLGSLVLSLVLGKLEIFKYSTELNEQCFECLTCCFWEV